MEFGIFFVCFLILATGACIGSFLNVVALRALSKESIIFPASKCPKCNEPIKWYDNIPVFSYLFTFRGKCRNCGCKVSLQYPIVEALTAVVFLATVYYFGFTLNTLLFLLLFCISLVIMITDFKEHSTFDVHLWILIVISIIASLYFKGIENYTVPLIGLVAGVIVMELIARIGYYLIINNDEKNENTENNDDKKTQNAGIQQNENNNQDNNSPNNNDEDIDINDYVKKNKRVFGDGDTYIAAATGAMLGWNYFLVSLVLAIIVQALCILPQSLSKLYKQGELKFIISFALFIIFAAITYYLHRVYLLKNTTVTIECIIYILIAFVAFFGIYAIRRLRNIVHQQNVVDDEYGFFGIPFGPALLISAFITYFFGEKIMSFIIKNIFLSIS